MPAVYNSLVSKQHIAPHKAWRISFVVPGILIVFVALCLLLLCDDTPTGRWSDRALAPDAPLHRSTSTTVPVSSDTWATPSTSRTVPLRAGGRAGLEMPSPSVPTATSTGYSCASASVSAVRDIAAPVDIIATRVTPMNRAPLVAAVRRDALGLA